MTWMVLCSRFFKYFKLKFTCACYRERKWLYEKLTNKTVNFIDLIF